MNDSLRLAVSGLAALAVGYVLFGLVGVLLGVVVWIVAPRLAR